MSTRSRPPPSTEDDPFRSVDPKLIYFSPRTNTLRVDSLDLHDPADVYHDDKHMFDLLVGGTWNAADETIKSQIQNNQEDGRETFAELLTKNIEAFANGKPSFQTRQSNFRRPTNLDIVATPRAYPVGAAGTLFPVNPGTLEPTVRFERSQADGTVSKIDLELPLSYQISQIDQLTGELRPSAMTPRQHAWGSVADLSFFPLRTDCEEPPNGMLRNPTADNEAAAVRSLKTAGEFFANRKALYNTDILEVRPQYPDQRPDESAQSQSAWSFAAPGNPKLNVSVKPISDMNCLPRGTPHTFEIKVRGEGSLTVPSGTAGQMAAGLRGARPI